jgi:hypothetical protein
MYLAIPFRRSFSESRCTRSVLICEQYSEVEKIIWVVLKKKTSMADSNGLRNIAHEINAFVKEARDVKVEYDNMNT